MVMFAGWRCSPDGYNSVSVPIPIVTVYYFPMGSVSRSQTYLGFVCMLANQTPVLLEFSLPVSYVAPLLYK